MTKRNSLIAAAAVAVAGTAGMAGWLSAEAGSKAARGSVAAPAAETQPGVVETESAVLPPAPVDAPAAPELVIVEQPFVAPPSRPVERAPRTPIAAPAPAVNRAPAPAPAPRAESTRRAEPIEPVEPVERVPVPVAAKAIEIRVPAGTVLGVRLATSLSSDTAEVEDRVEATVTRDVIAGGRVAIPAGTRVLGSVNEVTRGGKFKERARLGIRFHTLVLADGARETVRVDAIVREGDSPARESAAKIGGGAVGGAIIGGIMGGKKGAILGGAAGASAGTAVVVAGDRSVATLAAGSPLSVRLDAPVTVLIERN